MKFLLNLASKLSHLHHKLYIIIDIITVMTLADHTPETLCCTAIERRYASDKLNNKYVKPPIKVVEENLQQNCKCLCQSTSDV